MMCSETYVCMFINCGRRYKIIEDTNDKSVTKYENKKREILERNITYKVNHTTKTDYMHIIHPEMVVLNRNHIRVGCLSHLKLTCLRNY